MAWDNDSYDSRIGPLNRLLGLGGNTRTNNAKNDRYADYDTWVSSLGDDYTGKTSRSAFLKAVKDGWVAPAAEGGQNPYPHQPIASQFPAFMPGAQNLLARQLGAGFGGDWGPIMSQMYNPTTVFKFPQPISAIQAGFNDKKGYDPFNTGNAALDELLMQKPAVLPNSGKKNR